MHRIALQRLREPATPVRERADKKIGCAAFKSSGGFETRVRVRARRGGVVIEFALILPILIFLIMGVLEMGRLWLDYNILQHAAREGARLACILPDLDTNDARVLDRVRSILGTGGIAPELMTLQEYQGGLGGQAAYGGTSIVTGDTVSLRVRARVVPVVAALFPAGLRAGIPLQAEVITIYEH